MIEQLQKVKDSYNCDALSIAGATAAIGDQQWLEDNRAKVIATRTKLTDAMRELGFDVSDSHANFVWCTSASKDLQALYTQLQQHQILVRYMNYADWGEGLRITVGTDEQNDALIAVLQSIL